FFRARVLPPRRRNKRNRIYISRRAARVGRRILNEGEVLDLLANFGVRSYALETLSLEEQIDLFFDADLVVAPHGAGLTNLLFADGAGVVELHPTAQIMPHYFLLSLAVGHHYRYLAGSADRRDADFRV